MQKFPGMLLNVKETLWCLKLCFISDQKDFEDETKRAHLLTESSPRSYNMRVKEHLLSLCFKKSSFILSPAQIL